MCAFGCGHIHLCFDDFLFCSFLSMGADIPILLYALVLHISFHVHTINHFDLNWYMLSWLVPAKAILDRFWSHSTLCIIKLENILGSIKSYTYLTAAFMA